MALKTGICLLSDPFMLDPNFRRAVILICDHQKEGSVGFILNKPISMSIDSLVSSFPEFDSEVYYGGPMQTDTIHYIHTKGDLLEGSIEVLPGIYWGGDFTQLKTLIENKLITTNDIRFFVGYSGWSEGQLKAEMDIFSWLIADCDPNYIFSTENDTLWKTALENEGDTYSVIGQMALPVWN
ncbi:MAG: YqgE/AlgH family protein [Aureispira sp.]|nr:YqgE/AlgH family protein [Aureispira sp.]